MFQVESRSVNSNIFRTLSLILKQESLDKNPREGGKVSDHKYAAALSVAYEVRSLLLEHLAYQRLETSGHYFWYYNKVEIVAITGPVKLLP